MPGKVSDGMRKGEGWTYIGFVVGVVHAYEGLQETDDDDDEESEENYGFFHHDFEDYEHGTEEPD